MRKIDRQIVAALLVSQDNKLLIGMKNPDKGGVYSDCWHIPGGGIEDGEDKINALKREIMEEVGLDISTYKVELIDDKGSGVSIRKLNDGEEVECHMQFNVFRVDITLDSKDINVDLTDDLEKYMWVELNQLSNYKLTPPLVELFNRLGWLLS